MNIHSLNTMDFASDGSFVAGGFADSSVRLWNLKKSPNKKDDYTVLWGHSGPGTSQLYVHNM
jgi:WD40 repeat protein